MSHLITFEVNQAGSPTGEKFMENWDGTVTEFVVHWYDEEKMYQAKEERLNIANPKRSRMVRRLGRRMVIINSVAITNPDQLELKNVGIGR